MAHLSIAPTGDHLVRGGEPFIVVADTAWSAFADAQIEEWRQYVRLRVNQGFNAALVSVLPVLHDRSVRDDSREPFALDEDGHYQFSSPESGYFRTAAKLAEIAREEGMTLGLAVLWNNYVAGTWGAERTPWAVMTNADRERYISLVTSTFAEFDPFFIISGDDSFTDDGPIEVYGAALQQVKREAPHCLTTMHSAPTADLPSSIADSSDLDFYSYQAGHDIDHQDRTTSLASLYLAKPVRRPIIDLEPCYEGHGYGSGAGRYRNAQVRNALWWSIVGGASAGIGYGAHGVWQWHREGAHFTSPGFSLEPFDRELAMQFPGAADASFAGALIRDYNIFTAVPRQDLLANLFPGLVASASPDLSTIVIYMPDARELQFRIDLSKYRVIAWDLANRTRLTPRLIQAGDTSRLRQLGTLSDCLVVATAS